MEYLLPTITGLCLSALTGFRAFVPPLILGLIYRMYPDLVNISDTFAFLADTPVLIALGTASLIEFLGDKIPVLDSFLSWLELPAKMAFSAIITFALVPDSAGWFYHIAALGLAETAALTVHTGKTGVRAASTVVTGSIGNPVISAAEDAVSILGAILAVLAPAIALIVVIFIFYKCLKFLLGKKGGNSGAIAKASPSLFWYTLSRYIATFIFKTYNRMTVRGHEKLPSKSQCVVVANHASILDGFIIGCASRMPVYIMVKKESFENPILGWYLRKLLCFPVDRSKVDATAVKTALKILNDGKSLGIFPEGTRNREGFIGEFKPGATKFALKKKVPIVPAYIENAHVLTPVGKLFPRPVKLSVTFLDPINTEEALKAGKTEEQILDEIYNLICEKGKQVTGREVRVK